MNTMSSTQLVLHLPEDVIESLKRTANLRHKTLDEIATEALRLSLQPIRQEAMQRLEDQVKQQNSLPAIQQRAMLNARLSSEEQERLTNLLDSNRERNLTDAEQSQLDILYERIEAVATQKAAALLLLSEKATSINTTK